MTAPTVAPKQTMAIWALVLSFIWCAPIAVVVGIALAITVLVQSRQGGDRGRKKAIAALVIGGLGIAVIVSLVVAAALGAFDAKRGPDGQVTTSGSVSSNELRIGDCFDQPAPGHKELHVTTVKVVPCAQPHQWEVFHSFDLASGPYPGENDAARFAEGGCIDAYKAFDGVAYSNSKLHLIYLYPLPSHWASGDHKVTCTIGLPEPTVTGTLRNSGR